MKYVALLRGINVGGKNKVPMADLRICLEQLGYTNISTYIASGNALFQSNKPTGFGEQPTIYHSDVIFLMGIQPAEALQVFDPREGVDAIWPGSAVIYSQRLSTERTKSRLAKIVGTPAYRSMTIRTWNTVVKLQGLLNA